jgi:hypothetical protein
MIFLQNSPFLSGNGGGAIFLGINNITADKLLLGGDVRQSRLTFTMRGPEVLGGATPVGVLELDLGSPGYTVISSPGVQAAAYSPPSGMATTGSAIGLASNTVTTDSRADEAVLPRLRVAYVELNWGAGNDIIRVGQYHNLLLGMIAASASHIATPLGYGAGQLGYRAPGITFLHRLHLSSTTNLDLGLQVNRNSWRDELPYCSATQLAPIANCLPGGISVGEASGLPQVEARLMITSGLAENPLPFYYPTVWQVYLVGHWDTKDLSGLGAPPPGAVRDRMDTLVGQLGFKFQLGPVLVAANGYYGKNSGNVLGNILQMQNLDRGDINGFGVWGQAALALTKHLSLWGFAGIDKPNENQTIAAFTGAGQARVQNVQLAGMLAYSDGPVILAAEFLSVQTKTVLQTVATMTAPSTLTRGVWNGVQPSITLVYNF